MFKFLDRFLDKILKDEIDKDNGRNREEHSLSRLGREQFLKLKEKGLSIRIFTF